MSQLFRPITLRDLTVRNRVWVAPMCQYSAVDGVPDDWHLVHLGSFARGGAGLVITEATAVVPEGRISPADTGLWNDEQQQAWARIVDFVHGAGAAAGIQLAHAGRKASTQAPWAGAGGVADEDGGWTPVGPSASAFPGLREPEPLDARASPASSARSGTPRARARRRLRRARDPRRARLPAARVPLAAVEPARPTSTAAPSTTGPGCCSRWSARCAPGAGRRPGGGADLGHRLGRGRLGRRRLGAAGRPARRRGRRPGRRLDRRQRAGADPGRSRATRCRSPAGSARRPACPPARSA